MKSIIGFFILTFLDIFVCCYKMFKNFNTLTLNRNWGILLIYYASLTVYSIRNFFNKKDPSHYHPVTCLHFSGDDYYGKRYVMKDGNIFQGLMVIAGD